MSSHSAVASTRPSFGIGRDASSKGTVRTTNYLNTRRILAPLQFDGATMHGRITGQQLSPWELPDFAQDASGFTGASRLPRTEALQDHFIWVDGLGWLGWDGRTWEGASEVSVVEVVRR
jgi:hypothetical protein